MTSEAATFDLEQTSRGLRFVVRGDWIVANLKPLDGPLRKLADKNHSEREFIVDLGGVTRLDTAGAFVLYRTIKEFSERGVRSSIVEISQDFQTLFDQVAANDRPCELEPPIVDPLVLALDRIGAAIAHTFNQARSIMGLLGVTIATFGRALQNPKRFRIASLVFHMEQAGLDAVPIISLLTFLIGAVVAFLGAKILRLFGAEVFTVELVGFAILRELSVILTAIIVAGRSGSAFAAQIGTMVVNEEVDAM
ncbi:MAG: ABC transporter permease, partial [Gammaproteobacteria bacterium]